MSFLAPPAPANANRRAISQAPVASNTLGTPWPTLWGQRDVNGTVIVWTNHRFSGSGASGKGGGQVSSGEKDYRTFALGLCIGPIDRLTQILYDNQIIWQGTVSLADASTEPSDTLGVGGVILTSNDNRGTIALYFGLPTQTQDPVLAQFITNAPSYRGMCYAVFHGDRTGTRGFRIGNADTLAQIALRITRIPPAPPGTTFAAQSSPHPGNAAAEKQAVLITLDASAFTGNNDILYRLRIIPHTDVTVLTAVVSILDGLDTGGTQVITKGVPFPVGTLGLRVTLNWADGSSAVLKPDSGDAWDIQLTSGMAVGGGACVAAILYELLTSNVHGLSLNPNLLDAASFRTITTLASNAGLSYVVTTKDQARQLVDDLLQNVQGALVISNGKLGPRFLVEGTGFVLTLQSDDIVGLKQRPGAWYELPQHVTVKFRDINRKFRDTVLSLPGAGDFGDDDKNVEIDLPMVTSDVTARLIGTRLRTLLALPKTPDTILCGRGAFPVQFGDFIAVNDPPRGFNPLEALVVLAVREHGIGDELIELDVAPNIFGQLPVTQAIIAGSGGSGGGPSQPIQPIQINDAFELPWDFATDQSRRFTVFAARPAPDAEGLSLWASTEQPAVDYDEVDSDAPFHAGGTIKAVAFPRFTMDREAHIDFGAASDDVGVFSSLSDTDWFGYKMLVLIGSGDTASLYAASEILFLGNGLWRVQGLFGPLSDTPAAGGDVDDHIWIFRLQPLYNVLAEPSWVNGSIVTFKGIPFGSRLSSTLGDALAAAATVVARASRPFPADNLVANGRGSSMFPSYGGAGGNDIAIAWSLRNRGFGFGYETNPSPFDPTIDSEIDSCDVEIWVGGTLKRTQSVNVRHGPVSTSVVSGAGISPVAFDLASVAGLQPGDRISLVHAGDEYFARIQSISGSTIALVSALPFTPSVNDAVNRYEAVGYVYDAATNQSDNGGSLANAVGVKVYPKLNGLRALRAAELTVTKQ